jgi:hemolysin D
MTNNKQHRTKDELEFLPAALEVVETPANPLGRKILWAIMIFFLITVIWAIVGKVDIVAIAQGKIIPAGQIKIIQPIQTSTVKFIHVEEGQRVEKGQLLIELDSTQQGADITRLQAEAYAAQQDLIRIETLLNKLQPVNNKAQVANNNEQSARIEAEYNQYQSQLASIEQEIKQRQAEHQVTKTRISQLQKTVPLVTERASSYKKLSKDGTVARNQWLELEQQRIEKSKELEAQRNQKKQIEAAIEANKQKLISVKQQIIADLLRQQQEAKTTIAITQQEIIKAQQRSTLQQLTSPIAGVVQQLAVHTIGGVVTPAQELMRVVPAEGALEVEAFFQNKDIGFVKEGQRAEIKIDAFPFTKYGTINAEIKTLSNDAISNEDLGLIYTARIKMEQSTIKLEDKTVNLSPGMSVNVEAKTGTRRLIEYLMSPLLRYKDESVRER